MVIEMYFALHALSAADIEPPPEDDDDDEAGRPYVGAGAGAGAGRP